MSTGQSKAWTRVQRTGCLDLRTPVYQEILSTSELRWKAINHRLRTVINQLERIGDSQEGEEGLRTDTLL